jgi:hypothetical protein
MTLSCHTFIVRPLCTQCRVYTHTHTHTLHAVSPSVLFRLLTLYYYCLPALLARSLVCCCCWRKSIFCVLVSSSPLRGPLLLPHSAHLHTLLKFYILWLNVAHSSEKRHTQLQVPRESTRELYFRVINLVDVGMIPLFFSTPYRAHSAFRRCSLCSCFFLSKIKVRLAHTKKLSSLL